MVPTLFGIMVVNFLIIQAAPGGPRRPKMIPKRAPKEPKRAQMNPQRPPGSHLGLDFQKNGTKTCFSGLSSVDHRKTPWTTTWPPATTGNQLESPLGHQLHRKTACNSIRPPAPPENSLHQHWASSTKTAHEQHLRDNLESNASPANTGSQHWTTSSTGKQL